MTWRDPSALVAHGAGLARFPGEAAPSESDGDHVMGVAVHAWLAGYPVQRWGRRWLSGGEMVLRYRRPVSVGDQLEVRILDEPETMEIVVQAPSEDVVARAQASEGLNPSLSFDFPDPASFGPPSSEHQPIAPVAEALEGRSLGALDVDFDADRDLAFLHRVEGDEPWATLGYAHPAWLSTAVNELLSRRVAFDHGRWIHAGTAFRSLHPIPTGTSLRLAGRIERLFDRDDRRFADAAVVVTDAEGPAAIIVHTIVYA